MRYYGGGIGHLNNTPLQQAHRSDPLNPNSGEMAVDEDEDSDTESGTRDGPQDIVMNSEELEVGDEAGRGGEDDIDEDDYDSCGYDEMDEGGDEDEDEDEDEGGSDSNEEDDYGYASA